MTNNLSNPFQSTCAVCLGTFHLQGQKDSPIRHGFTAHNIVHGQTGGWHTGPCHGINFPHLGVSTAGTEWALGQILQQLGNAQAHLSHLQSRPELTWTFRPTKYVRATWQSRKSSYVPDESVFISRLLKPGTEAECVAYRQEGNTYDQHVNVPSYEQELAHRIADTKARVNTLEGNRDTYQAVIDGWKPFAKVAVKKVEMVHKAIQHSAGFQFASCNRRIKGGLGAKMSTNDAEVTCKRCLGH